MVFNQLKNFLNSNGLFDKFDKSGFRQHYSTETALIRVINDIRLDTDSGKVSVLVPTELKSCSNVTVLKSKVKKFLFSSAYG